MGGLSGFLRYPGGEFTPDPASDLTHSSFKGPNASTIGYGPTYDSTEGRWVPVPRMLVSPDGKSYAYEELVFSATPGNGPAAPLGSRIHVVDIASSADRVVLDGRVLWSAVAYSGSSVYLIHPCFEGCGPDAGGLWTLDPSSGAIQELVAPDAPVPFNPSVGLSQHIWTVVGSDAAWGTDPQGGLARLDLSTKTVSVWFTVPGKMLRVMGLDSRALPIVEGEADYNVAGSTRGGAWVVRGPRDAAQIAPNDLIVDDALDDGHGIWLLSFEKVDLWMPPAHLQQVGSAPASTAAKSLSGPCVS